MSRGQPSCNLFVLDRCYFFYAGGTHYLEDGSLSVPPTSIAVLVACTNLKCKMIVAWCEHYCGVRGLKPMYSYASAIPDWSPRCGGTTSEAHNAYSFPARQNFVMIGRIVEGSARFRSRRSDSPTDHVQIMDYRRNTESMLMLLEWCLDTGMAYVRLLPCKS